MRNFLLFILMLISSAGYAQTSSFFTLSDTSFTVGSAYRACRIDFDLDGRGLMPYSNACLDTFATFLIAHPELIIEIGSYTDQRGGDSSNLKLSQARAGMVKKYLMDHGVNENVLAAVGYGEQFPVIPQSQIDTAKTKATKERLYQQNRRTEFRILYIFQSILNLNDSLFTVGSTMRPYILFDLGKATIRPECLPLIDSIAKFLIAHPDLKVEISNHRDSRGSDKYSSKPTYARAKSVADRLLQQGVPSSQITYQGYDDTKPLVTKAYILARNSKEGQEQLHRLNRRTEIKILSTGQ